MVCKDNTNVSEKMFFLEIRRAQSPERSIDEISDLQLQIRNNCDLIFEGYRLIITSKVILISDQSIPVLHFRLSIL